MTAKLPWCRYGTCLCAARAMQNGATEAEITSGVMNEQVLLAGIGFQRISDYGTMMLDLGDGIVMIMGVGGNMNAEAMAVQTELFQLLELHKITDHWLLGLSVPDQMHLALLGHVAQELVSADFDAAMLEAEQPAGSPAGKPDLMALMGMPHGAPTIDHDTLDGVVDIVEISAVRAADLFAGRLHHTERIREHV